MGNQFAECVKWEILTSEIHPRQGLREQRHEVWVSHLAHHRRDDREHQTHYVHGKRAFDDVGAVRRGPTRVAHSTCPPHLRFRWRKWLAFLEGISKRSTLQEVGGY